MRGTVMKITDQCLVVLCGDGRFRNIPPPNPLPALGDTIEVPEEAAAPSRRMAARSGVRRLRIPGIAASACAVVGLLLISAWLYLHSGAPAGKQAVTLVAIDINPSMEWQVDAEGMVRNVTARNPEAERLVQAGELVDRPLEQSFRTLLDRAKQMGYLGMKGDEKPWVFVSVVDPPGSKLNETLQAALPEDGTVKLLLHTADRTQLEQAKQEELSLNAYLVYRDAQDRGIPLPEDMLRSTSIAKALHSAGVEVETLYGDRTAAGVSAAPSPSAAAAASDSALPSAEPGTPAPTPAKEAEGRTPAPASVPAAKASVLPASLAPSPSASPASTPAPTAVPAVSSSADAVSSLELYVRGGDNKMVKVSYRLVQGAPVASYERYAGGDQEKLNGERGAAQAGELITKLGLGQGPVLSADLTTERILGAAGIPASQWLEIQLKVTWEKGGSLQIRRLPEG
ncbi:anti-sigma factor domain-containing protein [Gorillibacterium sp. sgz5001074]|uniref:anti-sigma factor domain-containing protein n=1 Tax=Gorillibacterium sp. sgz5001074 TaxID=3446695 RepID=UPI003F67C560